MTRSAAGVRDLVQTLWDYHRLGHRLAPADAILVLCSHDTAVARHGATLALGGWAPLLILSGGLGSITKDLFTEPEADQFARIAAGMGVPDSRMIVENRSTNTGENVLFTKRLLEDRGVHVRTVILVQKPYMERRAFATFRKPWPEPGVIVSSPPATLDEYLDRYSNAALTQDDVINIIVGDLQRIREYARMGFQIGQTIPDDVWAAYEELVALGYTKRLIEPHSA